MELGRVPARTHPRSPASNIVIGGSGILTRGWHQRLWAPFLSSDFLLLPPFLCFPGELRALALLGAPLLPLPSGAPLPPRHPGATGGRHFPPLPLREAERWSSLPIAPPGVAPVGPREVQGRYPPHPGGLGTAVAAPAFVGGPTASLSAPRVLPWGLGNRDRQSWRPGLP
jgi:hypothetical protein